MTAATSTARMAERALIMPKKALLAYVNLVMVESSARLTSMIAATSTARMAELASIKSTVSYANAIPVGPACFVTIMSVTLIRVRMEVHA